MDISVVIPVFNRKEYIERTVSSIASSGIPLKNVILVDNGSTDGSLELMGTFPERFDLNFIILQEKTPGAAAARNAGLSICSSRWVYFFDSDDIFTGLPESWDEDADMVCFPTAMDIAAVKKTRSFIPCRDVHVQILSSMLNTPSMIFNADFLRNIGGWNQTCHIWDDWELGIRCLIGAKRIHFIPDKTYHLIYIHPDSITGANFSAGHKDLSTTLHIALNDIQAMKDTRRKKKCTLALYLRICILCGHYGREGNRNLAEETFDKFTDSLEPGIIVRIIGRLLFLYVSIGGRGAWRLALVFVNYLPLYENPVTRRIQ